MKKIYFFVMFMVIAVCSFASDGTNLNTNVDSKMDSVMYGGEQYMIFNSNGAGRQHITSHPDTMFPYYGPINYKHYQWNVFQGDMVIHSELLPDSAEVEKHLKEIKWTGKFFMPENDGKMFRLLKKPYGLNDINIFTAELHSAHGGVPEYTEKILLKLNNDKCHSKRFFTTIFLESTPVAKGISLGSGGNYSKALSGAEGLSFAVNPMLGVSWTELKVPYTIKIHFYNNGPVIVYDSSSFKVKTAKKPKKPSKKTMTVPIEDLSSIHFDTDKSIIKSDQKEKISEHVIYVIENWKSLLQLEHVIVYIGECDIRYTQNYNDTLGIDRGKAVREAVAKKLFTKGYNRTQVYKVLLYAGIGEREKSKMNNNDRKVKAYLAKKITENN